MLLFLVLVYDPIFIANLVTENQIAMRKPIRAARQGFEVYTNTPEDYRKLIRENKICKLAAG